MKGIVTNRLKVSALSGASLLGCTPDYDPRPAGEGDDWKVETSDATESNASTGSSSAASEGSESESDDGAQDDGPRLDSQVEPPSGPIDAFPTGAFGCQGASPGGVEAEIDAGSVYASTNGWLRLRLEHEVEGDSSWSLFADLASPPVFPAAFVGIETAGYYTVPAEWEIQIHDLTGVIEIEVLAADPMGCFVAEILESESPLGDIAPPRGWIVLETRSWPAGEPEP